MSGGASIEGDGGGDDTKGERPKKKKSKSAATVALKRDDTRIFWSQTAVVLRQCGDCRALQRRTKYCRRADDGEEKRAINTASDTSSEDEAQTGHFELLIVQCVNCIAGNKAVLADYLKFFGKYAKKQ